MIEDVIIKELKTNADDRGFFRELIRVSDDFFSEGFGQWSHSLMFDGVIKAWHLHRIQTDWWYVVNGVLRVGLCDMRPDSQTYKTVIDLLMGDLQAAQVLKIPPGVAHGCKTIQGPVNLFYVTSHVYNPDDEIRLPYNDPEIDFDWLKGSTIK
jgi:dTDP-4-dehydrorhamnose 3,5-epimerase